MIELNYYPYDLKFSEVFAVSSNARTSTDVIFVELAYEGKTGYGQASYPPYMQETRANGLSFLSKVDFSQFKTLPAISEVISYLDSIDDNNRPAKAAIDMAFYDLIGKLQNTTVSRLCGIETVKEVHTSFTIGIGNDDFILRQLKKAEGYTTLKMKLNGDIDYNKHAIELVRRYSAVPIGVDFNEGLTDEAEAMVMLEWLGEREVYYAEQPLPVIMEEAYKRLKIVSPILLFGDESIQTIDDIESCNDMFHGINIKLMKCGGLYKAMQMVVMARKYNLKLMLGCMAESVCATTAAAHIAGVFDVVDIDGHLQNANDVFEGVMLPQGKVVLSKEPGLGLIKVVN